MVNETTTDQGLKITSKADGPSSNLELNLEGTFENLHDGGTLDVHTVKSQQLMDKKMSMR